MHRKINNVISVFVSFVRCIVLKIFHFNSFFFKGIERFSPNVSIELDRGGNISLGRRVRAHSGVKIKVRKKACLVIGDNVSFNYNCMVFCRDKIEIGEGVEFGPGVLIYDHDHDYKTEGGIKAGKFLVKPVIIGANAWIGANTVILRGSVIGENAVIGAGSIIKGKVPAGSVFIQKREARRFAIESDKETQQGDA